MVLKFIPAALLISYFPWKTFFFLELEVGEPLALRLGQFSLSSRSLTPKDAGGSLAHTQQTDIKFTRARHRPGMGSLHVLDPVYQHSREPPATPSFHLPHPTPHFSLHCFALLPGTHGFLTYFIFYKFTLRIVHLSPNKTIDSVKTWSLLSPRAPGRACTHGQSSGFARET